MSAVIGALACQAFSASCTIAFLVLIFGLLCTTPADAIRLPRWGSEMFILLSTTALRAARWPMPVGMHMAILLLMLVILRLWRKSPWWAVLYAWFPVYGT